jgi:hypothetical protein
MKKELKLNSKAEISENLGLTQWDRITWKRILNTILGW